MQLLAIAAALISFAGAEAVTFQVIPPPQNSGDEAGFTAPSGYATVLHLADMIPSCPRPAALKQRKRPAYGPSDWFLAVWVRDEGDRRVLTARPAWPRLRKNDSAIVGILQGEKDAVEDQMAPANVKAGDVGGFTFVVRAGVDWNRRWLGLTRRSAGVLIDPDCKVVLRSTWAPDAERASALDDFLVSALRKIRGETTDKKGGAPPPGGRTDAPHSPGGSGANSRPAPQSR